MNTNQKWITVPAAFFFNVNKNLWWNDHDIQFALFAFHEYLIFNFWNSFTGENFRKKMKNGTHWKQN